MDSSLADWRQLPGLREIRFITLFSVGCWLGCWLWVRLLKSLFLLCYMWLASLKKLFSLFQSSSVQSLSHVRLCHPMNHSMPGLPVHHQLPEFTQTHVHWVDDAIQLSHPLLSPSPPTFNLSQHQSLFAAAAAAVAAAAKLLQSWLTLCDTIDSSPPGSPVSGILQARVLE